MFLFVEDPFRRSLSVGFEKKGGRLMPFSNVYEA
jgi:hypothetical protein